MGGQPWGGGEIPVQLTNAYSAYAGLDSTDKFDGAPIYPTYNLREEMERLWAITGEHVNNPSFNDNSGGNCAHWYGDEALDVLPDRVVTDHWVWNDPGGYATHMNGDTKVLIQPAADQRAALVDGNIYRVTYTVTGRTAGTITIKLGGGEGTARSTNESFTEDIQCDGSVDTNIRFVPSSTFDGNITGINIVSLTDCPYSLVTLHDPNPDVDAVDARYTTYNGDVTAISPASDWASDAAAVKAAVDANISWVAEIDSIVASYESDQLPELLRSQTRFLSTLAGGGAIHSTAAWKGLGIMEGQFNRGSGNFRATAALAGYQDRAKAIVQGVGEVQAARKFKVESGRLATAMKQEIARMNILANNDFIREQLQMDVEAEMWNINLLDKVKSVNTITGAPVLQRGLTNAQAMTSLAFSALGGIANMIPAMAKLF